MGFAGSGGTGSVHFRTPDVLKWTVTCFMKKFLIFKPLHIFMRSGANKLFVFPAPRFSPSCIKVYRLRNHSLIEWSFWAFLGKSLRGVFTYK